MSNPKVSVVTVVYNSEQYIERTIKSVVSQTYSNIEYIVIDGGSSDSTIDIVNKYIDRIQFFISEKDNGIYDAMNKGIKLSNGEWLIFMNSGDVFFDSNVIKNIFEGKEFPEKIKAIFGDKIDVKRNYEKYVKSFPIWYIKRNMPCSHQSIFVRTSKKSDILFDLQYKYCADYKVIYSIFWKYGATSILRIPQIISKINSFEGLTASNKHDTFYDVLNIRREHKDIIWLIDYLYIKLIFIYESLIGFRSL